ncbi:hypothetical protein JCM12178A_22860 [Salidesulfovibrio brasiliensis]
MLCWNTSLNMSNKQRVAIFMVATFVLLTPSVGNCGTNCEFELSCQNVESIAISYGPSPLKVDAEGKWLNSYRCAIFLKDTKFENFIRHCTTSHYRVVAKGTTIAKESTSSVPIGEWFIFYDESLNGILSKANQICADKVIVEPSADEAGK